VTRGSLLAVAGAIGLAGVLVAAQRAWAGGSPRAQQAQQTQLEQGEQLYLTGCSSCHGVGGVGTDQAPTLVGVGAASASFFLTTGRMPAASGAGTQSVRKQPAYSPGEIDALVAYVASLGPGPAIPEVDTAEASVSAGGVLFRANCAPCHQSAGSGGALSYGQYAPDLTDASARVIWGAMQSGPENMPRFSDNQLTVAEKKSVTRYVEFITKSPQPGGAALGRYGPVPEGLVMWLVGITALVGVTLWIGARA